MAHPASSRFVHLRKGHAVIGSRITEIKVVKDLKVLVIYDKDDPPSSFTYETPAEAEEAASAFIAQWERALDFEGQGSARRG